MLLGYFNTYKKLITEYINLDRIFLITLRIAIKRKRKIKHTNSDIKWNNIGPINQ